MKGIQILTEKNKKEVKEHGSYTFPVQVSPEAIQSYEQHSFMWHWHPEIELTWFVSGQMEYVVNDQRYIISEGEGIFCNSNALHAGYMIDDQDCNYISVTFHPKFIYGYENSILQTKYVDFITSNEFWSSLVLKPEISWQNEIIEYIKEIYRLTCHVQSSSASGYESMSEQPELPDYEFRVHLLLRRTRQCSLFQRNRFFLNERNIPKMPRHPVIFQR